MKSCCLTIPTFLLATALSSAAGITEFTAVAHPGAPFTVDPLNSTFISESADVFNSTITCSNPAGCSGGAIDFEVTGAGLGSVIPMTVSLVATFGPVTPPPDRGRFNVNDLVVNQVDGSVDLMLNGDPMPSYTFSQMPGQFNITLATLGLGPASGAGDFDITGTLNLSMPNSTLLALNTGDSLQISIFPPVPEPPAVWLLAVGIMLIGLAKFRARVHGKSQI